MEFSASHFDVDRVSGSLRQIPNVISAIRILLVVPIAVALLNHRLPATIALFALAALSDAADGFLAKRFGWQSDLGAVLDPAADKLLLASVFVVLAYLHLIPLWLMATAVARDAIIVTGALLYRFFWARSPCIRRLSANSTRSVRPRSSWQSSAGKNSRCPQVG